jgi:hypothetical protein
LRSTSLLLAVVLILATAATVCFAVRVPCPECLGEGLVQEPPGDWKARWIRERDLLPMECPSCSDRHRISLFRKWRRGSVKAPTPPVYRAKQTKEFADKRRLRATFLRDESAVGLNGAFSRAEILPLLTGALDDEDSNVRVYAVEGIAELKDEKALPVLLEALNHPEVLVQVRACRGLGWLPIREGMIPALKKAGDSAVPDVRIAAASALIDLGASFSADPFLEALKLKGVGWPDVRKVIVHFQRKEFTSALIKEMAKSPPNWAANYGKALEFLTGEKFGNDSVAWYRWFEKVRDTYPPQIE